jgi:hypothetical protein
MLAPWDALAMAVRMNMFVRAEVERARHVRTVNGLKRKLPKVNTTSVDVLDVSYPAAMALLLHRRSFLEDANSLETAADPLWATCANAYALKRSTTVKTMFVASGWYDGFGSSEKSGRRRGAWW